jgi:hypothetical protein
LKGPLFKSIKTQEMIALSDQWMVVGKGGQEMFYSCTWRRR